MSGTKHTAPLRDSSGSHISIQQAIWRVPQITTFIENMGGEDMVVAQIGEATMVLTPSVARTVADALHALLRPAAITEQLSEDVAAVPEIAGSTRLDDYLACEGIDR